MIKSITSEELEELIEKAEYTHTGKTSICKLVLKNGFEIIGTSGVLDRNNFDPKIGEKYSYQNAFNKLWELEGYHRQRIYTGE